ncbi:hypothetical protein BC828DRAFT_378706 [Blastocladiella britannica]|nr:hypothetical protein BC828DRAFT_378706 [Blastocladiella britannica]
MTSSTTDAPSYSGGYSLHVDAEGNVIATSPSGDVLYTGPVTELPAELRPATAAASAAAAPAPEAATLAPPTYETLDHHASSSAAAAAAAPEKSKSPADKEDLPPAEGMRAAASEVAMEVVKLQSDKSVPTIIRKPIGGLLKLVHNVLLLTATAIDKAERDGPDAPIDPALPQVTVTPLTKNEKKKGHGGDGCHASLKDGKNKGEVVIMTDSVSIKFKTAGDIFKAAKLAWDMPYEPIAPVTASAAITAVPAEDEVSKN